LEALFLVRIQAG